MEIDLQRRNDSWPRHRGEDSAPSVLVHALLALTSGEQPTAQYTQAVEKDDRTTAWRVVAVLGDGFIDVQGTADSWDAENARLDSARLMRSSEAVSEVRVLAMGALHGNAQVKVAWSIGLHDGESLELPHEADRSYAKARDQADKVALALVRLLQGCSRVSTPDPD